MKSCCLFVSMLFKRFDKQPNSGHDQIEIIADNKLNTDKMTVSLLDRVENTKGKGENAGYQHFLLFPQCFPKPSSLGLFKIWIV